MSPELGGEVTVLHGAVRRTLKCCAECAQHYSPDSMFCPFDGTPLTETTWVAPTDPTVDPLLGTVIERRYRVERVLGEGGTGTVYEVTHLQLGRLFAIKVLRADVARDPALAARFLQEARATAGLKHPHIVSITDFGRLPDKTPYFVMERLVGRTLAELDHSGRLPVGRAVRIVLQIADALGAAHEAGVVHRDLKPENVFIVGDPAKGADDVRVVDFGAAKIAGATRITKTGIVFGTPHYMSPEQASGQPVDHRADIYALGVIMYELFSGGLPFQADTLMGVLTKHMFVEPPPFPATEDPESPEGVLLAALQGATMRALAKKPEDRFQSMSAVSAELVAMVSFGDGDSVEVSPGWHPDPRLRAARSGSGLPAAAAPLPPQSPRALRPEVYPSEPVPTIPGTSPRGPLLAIGALLVGAAIGFVAWKGMTPSSDASASSAGGPSPSTGAGLGANASPPNGPVPSATSLASPPGGSVAATLLPIPKLVHVTSVPMFAEVWQDGRRIGTAPVDLPVGPKGPSHLTLRAPGYAESSLTLDSDSPVAVEQKLEALPAPLAPAHPKKPSAPKQSPSQRSGELVDPFL